MLHHIRLHDPVHAFFHLFHFPSHERAVALKSTPIPAVDWKATRSLATSHGDHLWDCKLTFVEEMVIGLP
jgi:hypothetical protein